jgi:uncharacterized lipoprotein YbaY
MRTKLIRAMGLALGLAMVQSLSGCGSDDPVAAAPAPTPADVATVGADLALPSTAKGTAAIDAAAALADLAELAPPDTSTALGAELLPPA